MASKIFISYRRSETAWAARAIFERLRPHFAADAFIDLAGLRLGQKFAEELDKLLNDCQVMLAVMGPEWLTLLQQRHQQVNKTDLMRHELARALQRNISVVPVLIDTAVMPDANDLPADLRGLVERHGLNLHFNAFDAQIAPLVAEIQSILGLPAGSLASDRTVPASAAQMAGALSPAKVLTPTPSTAKSRPPWMTKQGKDNVGRYFQFTVNGASQYMRWIEPGSFFMGSPDTEPERGDDERRHRVQLTQGFWMATTACTQALWQAVLGANPSDFSTNLQCPVECVSWDDIQDEFLPALNRLAPGLHAGLPTEAQWEYACRAGTETPFSFGKQFTPHQANYDGNHPYNGGAKGEYREKTVPVNSFAANDWGLHQMHGNVWEWCADGYGPYAKGDAVDPNGVDTSASRVLRGGSWVNDAGLLRAARRSHIPCGNRDRRVGFRLCCVSPIE